MKKFEKLVDLWKGMNRMNQFERGGKIVETDLGIYGYTVSGAGNPREMLMNVKDY